MPPRLTTPTERAAASFLAAGAEFRAEGRALRGTDDITEGWFARYLDALRRDVEAPGPGLAAQTTLWWSDGDEFLGRLAIRHRLTPALRRHGGHIGYEVRPSARRRGHATAMLQAALPLAADLGIDQALVTCDPGNVASRKVIEAAGGIRLDEPGPELRFWVSTSR
ncbi:MAG: GNAT family N-acetyltransferase [Pseudonocardia sp.]